MVSSNPKSPTGSSRRVADSWRRGGYVFLVTALAGFVVAICLLRDAAPRFVATAAVVPLDTRRRPADSAYVLLQQALYSAATIRSSVAQAGSTEADNGLDIAAALPGRLAVQRALGTAGSECLRVSLSGPNRGGTVTMLNALVRRAIDASTANRPITAGEATTDPRRDADVREAEAATAAAQRDLQAARKLRDDFVATNREALAAAEREASRPTDDAVAAPVAPPRPPSEEELALRRQLKGLQAAYEEADAQRKALLVTLTPEHPRCQMVMDQMTQIRSEIDEILRQLPPPAPAVPQVTRQQQARIAARQRREQLLGELARLERAVSDAQSRSDARRRSLAGVQAAAAVRLRVQADEPAVEWRVEPAVEARRVSQPMSVPVVLLSAAVALVVGSGTLLAGGASQTISGAADVASSLQLAVLGSLPDRGEPTAARRRSMAGLLRAAPLLGELALAVVLLFAIVAALMDHEFAAQLAADPLSGLADGLRRLPELLGGLSW